MSLFRWSIILLILLFGARARSFDIAAQSVWIDEGYSYYFAFSPDLAGTLASDVHPPLYFAALRLWGGVAGHSELALRWFSLLPSLCSLAVVFQLGKEIRRARAAEWDGTALPALAMLALALADVENQLAQEIRHYTWMCFFVLCGMFFLLRWLRRSRKSDWLAWLLASILMLYTHYIAAFALAAQALYLALWTRGQTRLRGIAALVISGLALTPWLLAVGARQLANREAHRSWALDLSGELLREIGESYFTGQWALMLALLGLGCFALVYGLDARASARFDRFTPLLLLWLVAPFGLTVLVNEFLPFLLPHRLVQWTPAIALLVACGLCNLRQPLRALMIAIIVVYGVAHVEFDRVQPDWRRIAHLTTRYAAPGDLVLSDVSSGDYPLRYYMLREQGGERALEAGIDYEALQFQRQHHADGYESWLPSLLERQETVWLMYWSSDQSAFNWLERLGFARTAEFVHRHDGGAHGETLMRVYRYDRADELDRVAQFLNGIFLSAADFDAADLRLDAIWGTSQPLARDYVLSAKLLDGAGRVVAQHDGTAQLGQRNTSGWRVGEYIYSPHEMEAAATIAPGDYRVIVQVYTRDGDGFDNALTTANAEFAPVAEVQIAEAGA